MSRCIKCGAVLKAYWLKDGECNGCRNPHLVVHAELPSVPREMRLSLIDGLPPEPVLMVKPPTVSRPCSDDRHCAQHGNGPFFCCKCGAEFIYKSEVYVCA